MNNSQKYVILFVSGVLLQLGCIIAVCISSLSDFYINNILSKDLLLPNILSYGFMIFGALGLFGIFDLLKKITSSHPQTAKKYGPAYSFSPHTGPYPRRRATCPSAPWAPWADIPISCRQISCLHMPPPLSLWQLLWPAGPGSWQTQN